ncbi:MAG: hypothetical protein AB7E84_04645 [Xanthobacteraceae bacterium]
MNGHSWFQLRGSLPTAEKNDEAAQSARQTSASARVGRWITITLRRSVSGSCMNSRLTPPDIEMVAQAMQEYRRGSMSIVE